MQHKLVMRKDSSETFLIQTLSLIVYVDNIDFLAIDFHDPFVSRLSSTLGIKTAIRSDNFFFLHRDNGSMEFFNIAIV